MSLSIHQSSMGSLQKQYALAFSASIVGNYSRADAIKEIRLYLDKWLKDSPGSLKDIVIGLEVPLSQREMMEKEIRQFIGELQTNPDLQSTDFQIGLIDIV